MMLGEHHRSNPTIHVPPWQDPTEDMYSSCFKTDVTDGNAAAADYSPYYMQEMLTALHRYLPSNDPDSHSDSDVPGRESDAPVDAYSCDQFRIYEFKIRKCARGRSHDWTECPYAHPGEKARRRDPRKFHYSGTACPDFRKGNCKKGDACEHAHGVFECWLHPARYRTQPCKDGTSCRRRVCFFAHTPEQLRIVPNHSPRSIDSYDGSPMRNGTMAFMSSPISLSPPMSPTAESPPMSPMTRSSMNDMVASLRNLQLGKVKSMPSNRNVIPMGSPGFGSPRVSLLRAGFLSLPSTPTQVPGGRGVSHFDQWDQSGKEEPVMERVESGRGIRAKMFEKLSKENSLDGSGQVSDGAPDVEWVSELLE
ncbi:hypothetical protein Lal_00002766 [Lupinus albus]|uniref:Putative transcription factor C3H family n=1 Tax=Lupinus albus TaxID=3870 RepID=A0A6A5N8Z9_LUPAL|nr:putative transcription factor C3H family [Lupinus albus]KAF1882587.1 hypothetical protein Lal_00002766 [Lupinus albus]